MAETNWRDHLHTGREQFHYVFQNNLFSDVRFLVGREQTPVHSHSFVLKVRSAVFERLLEKAHGPVKEITIDDVSTTGFKRFIQFLYTDQLEVSANEALGVLPLAKKYRVAELTKQCTSLLTEGVDETNAASIFQLARDLKEIELEQKAIEIIQKYIIMSNTQIHALLIMIINNNASAVFSGKDFLNLSPDHLCFLLKMDQLDICETELFNALLEWGKMQCERHTVKPTGKHLRMMLKDAIPLVRFPVMSLEKFNSVVLPQDILNEKEVKEITKYLEAGVADKEFVKPASFSTIRRNLLHEADLDLSKTDEENHKRLAKFAVSKTNPQPGSAPMIVTSLILEVDPADKSIQMEDLKKEITGIKKYGLYWGVTNTVELPGGRKQLRISFAADTRRTYGVGSVVEAILDLEKFVAHAFVYSYKDEIVVRV